MGDGGPDSDASSVGLEPEAADEDGILRKALGRVICSCALSSSLEKVKWMFGVVGEVSRTAKSDTVGECGKPSPIPDNFGKM